MGKDGKFDRGRYTEIPETANVKLPIGGKIRLGIRKKNEAGIEYPVETKYFVCTKEVRAVFGDEPTEITVFFPTAHREEVFPQNYEKYGSNNALQCWGDGKKSGQRKNMENGNWEDVKCPCENYNKPYDKKNKTGGCVKAGYLKFMIPSVSIGTFYQCRVGGTVSIEECNSAFKLAEGSTGGHWAMIPFRMRRVAIKLKIPGTANMKTHWVVTLEIAASTEEIRRVMAGEVLYLGQRKKGKYELETIEPTLVEGNGVTEAETEEEAAAKEEKAKANLEARKKEYADMDERQVELKKKIDAGESEIRTPEETKKIKAAREKLITDIEKVAKKFNISTWSGIIEIGERYKIFAKGLKISQARTFICDHPDKYEELQKAIEGDQVIGDEDLPSLSSDGNVETSEEGIDGECPF